MKQEVLEEVIAISQQTISGIEGSEEVEFKRLLEIAKILSYCTSY